MTRAAPVSYAQRRMWLVQQRDPAGGPCNVCRVLRLRGRLDVAKLAQAIGALVQRHASLRTTFSADGGTQVAADDAVLALPLTDLGSVPPEERAAEIRRLAVDDAQRGFDLARAPLVRARLLRVDDDEHVLLFALHNLVCDGWSLGLLFRELAQRYGDDDGQAAPLPGEAMSYADFATRQRRRSAEGGDEGALAWWKDALTDAPPPPPWPGTAVRPAKPRYDAGRRKVLPPITLVHAIVALSHRSGVTPFTTWLAACLVLIARTTGCDRFLVGTLHAGRTRVETQSVVGPFADFLVLSTDLGGDPSFDEVLRRTHALARSAFEREVPFQRLVEALRPEAGDEDVPLFDTVVNYAGGRQRIPPRWGDLEVEQIDVDACASRFRWMLYVRDEAPLALELVHRTDLQPDADATAFLDQYLRVLEQACLAPDRPISTIDLPA